MFKLETKSTFDRHFARFRNSMAYSFHRDMGEAVAKAFADANPDVTIEDAWLMLAAWRTLEKFASEA